MSSTQINDAVAKLGRLSESRAEGVVSLEVGDSGEKSATVVSANVVLLFLINVLRWRYADRDGQTF
jgi:hypothetical protein